MKRLLASWYSHSSDGEEARADVAQLRAEGQRARERDAVDDAARREDRDVDRGGDRRDEHERVDRVVADVPGGLEAGRDDAVHPLGLGGQRVPDVRDGVEVEHPGVADVAVQPVRARMPAGGREDAELRADLRVALALVEDGADHVLGVGLLLRDPDVDRERPVGERDGEPDPVAHLLHDLADLLLELVAGDARLLEDERGLRDRPERARLGDRGGEAGQRDRADTPHARPA